MFAALLLVTLPAAEPAPMPRSAPTEKDVRAAATRSLAFLEKNTAAWRTERKCVSCHQVPFTMWALSEGKAAQVVHAAQTRSLLPPQAPVS